MDEAVGPSIGQAALAWHLSGGERAGENRFKLRGGDDPVEVLFVPDSPGGRIHVEKGDRADSPIDMRYQPKARGRLHIATVFLTDHWVGAEAAFDRDEGVLRLTTDGAGITVPLSAGGG
jgi:hypothetical protein